jgi:hypothetical protein
MQRQREPLPNPLRLDDVVTVDEDKNGFLTITYSDDKTVFLQTDWDRANFGVNCGLIEAPPHWTGIPDELPENWWERDWEDITQIPDYYREFAE